jgi:hypothetical protein
MIENPRISVLQDWVMALPLREQGTLLTAVRGCDLTPKYPLDSPARNLVASIRWAFMNPADRREVDREIGCFFRSQVPITIKPSAFGHYPQHYVSHLMHAMEVLAYRHPDPNVAGKFLGIYVRFCLSLHVQPESFDDFVARLSEDRITTDTVVS